MRHVATALMLLLLAGTAGAQQPAHPNVVLIVLDDARFDDLPQIPQVQDLAARGTSYTRAFAPFPLCTPSRSSILTGLYPATHGVVRNRIADLDASSTIATWFDAAGYATALLGKYGNGMKYLTADPPGWDVFLAFENHRDFDAQQSAVLGTWADAMVSVLPEPFFVYLAPVTPHGPLPGPTECAGTVATPFVPSPGFDESMREDVERKWALRARRYCGLRQVLARTLDALARRNVVERTVVMVVSDNGFMLGEHGEVGKNVLYEQAIHVPMVLAGPGIEGGAVKGALVSLTDVGPTLAELAGVPHPVVEGRNILATEPRNHLPLMSPGCTGKRRQNTKTVSCDTAPTLLYDLVADPWELNPGVQP